MIVHVLDDLFRFILVLACQVAMFTVVFTATDYLGEDFYDSQEDYKDLPLIIKAFFNSWDMMNGMAQFKPNTPMGATFYILFSIFINISMLNIVISVVSETYEKINKAEKECQV